MKKLREFALILFAIPFWLTIWSLSLIVAGVFVVGLFVQNLILPEDD